MPRSFGVAALCALGLAAGADAARGPSVTEHIKMSTESATAKPTRRRPSEVWSPEDFGSAQSKKSDQVCPRARLKSPRNLPGP